VLIPTSQFVRSLVAARLAADVSGVPTVLIARTDAHSANLLTSDVDEHDAPFIHGERTPEGFCQFNGGIKVTSVAVSHAHIVCCVLLIFPAP
jgi:isocitrate lyase